MTEFAPTRKGKAMINQISETSPKVKARLAGIFFLLTTLLGIFAQVFVSERLVISSDAAATATNILSNESLFRLGFAVYLVEMACQITMTAFFYDLLKPVNRSLSLLAAFFLLAGIVIKIFSRLFYIAPLLILGGSPDLSVFNTHQWQALALLFLMVNDQGPAIALVFFGFATLVKGYLVARSTFLLQFLGVLSMLGGLAWLSFLYPPLAYRLYPFILLIALAGTILQIFWLLVFGVNEQRWKEQASTAAE
jgi:hypothetical protein